MPVSDAKVHTSILPNMCVCVCVCVCVYVFVRASARVIISRCLYSFIGNFLFILPKLLCSRTWMHVNVNYSPLNMLKLEWLF